MVDLSVVIPCYNGRRNLVPLIEELTSVLQGTGLLWEILFIDDCSSDGSFEELSHFNKSDCRIKAIRLKENKGQQNAVYCGLNEAVGELIITMDDDLQHPPSVIPRLISTIVEGYDLVYAVNRRGSRSFILRAGTWLNGMFFTLFLKKPFSIEIGSYRIMKKDLAKRIKGEKKRFIYVSALIFRLRPPPEISSFRYAPTRDHRNLTSRFSMRNRYRLFRKLFFSYGPLRFLVKRSGEPYRIGDRL